MIYNNTYTAYSGDSNRTRDKTQAFVHANVKGGCPAIHIMKKNT